MHKPTTILFLSLAAAGLALSACAPTAPETPRGVRAAGGRSASSAAPRPVPLRRAPAPVQQQQERQQQQRPAEPGETAGTAPAGEGAAAEAAATIARRGAEEGAARPVADSWRVVADGTVGCALPEPLRVLRGDGGAAVTRGAGERQSPAQRRRQRAAALDEGRCLTTFRVNRWALQRAEGDLVLLRLVDPETPGEVPLDLWFARRDVVDATGEGGRGGGGGGGSGAE